MKNLISFILLLLLTFAKSQVICPDLVQQCDEGQTCCPSAEGYSCCPLEDAVCCSDLQHCCPDEYICVVQFNICVKCPEVSKRNFTIKLEPLQKSIRSFHQSNVCPGGQEQCPDGETCCQMRGGQVGCCPFPDAVCCSDGVHCCPEGYTCDVSEGLCISSDPKITVPVLPTKNIQNNIRQSNVCPGGQEQCPDGETCCQMRGGQAGCCPFPDAVCCSDGVHCCPEGYTCDVSEGLCISSDPKITVPMLSTKNKQINIRQSNVCPGGQEQCPDGETCCQMRGGQVGCCPFPDAVCCSDGVHCCPEGYTCDVSEGLCISSDPKITVPVLPTKNIQNNIRQSNVCPGGQEQCPDGETCCQMRGGQAGCCPFPDAVCCSDGVHCCPEGYTCDVSEGLCISSDPKITVPVLPTKNIQNNIRQSNVCPGGQEQCPDGETCCQMRGGQAGCCPFPDAVCCSDGVHCCPEGYTCDVSEGLCISSDPKITVPMLSTKNKQINIRQSNVCPGGQEQCPDGETCCQMRGGQVGCCPFPDAVCCSDGVHCCPEGFTCDVSEGLCISDPTKVNIIPKKIESWLNRKYSKIQKKQNFVQCPDGNYCNPGNTCCLITSNTYGCCPFSQAVCCSDKLHCCPGGMTCNSSGYCINGPDVISWFEKKPAIKRPKNLS